MGKFTDMRLTDQRIIVDGQLFENCVFDNCTLVYQGGPVPGFVRCSFNPPRFTFENQADNTLSFLKSLAADPGMSHVVKSTFPELFKG